MTLSDLNNFPGSGRILVRTGASLLIIQKSLGLLVFLEKPSSIWHFVPDRPGSLTKQLIKGIHQVRQMV